MLFGAFLLSAVIPASALDSQPFIDSAEDGVSSTWVRNTMSVMNLGGFWSMIDPDYGGAVEMVTTDDNVVFINYLSASFRTTGWVTGLKEGNTISLDLPRVVYMEDGQEYLLAAMDLVEEGEYYISNKQEYKLVFNGTAWVSEVRDDKVALGIVDAYGSWIGAADYDYEFTPFDGVEQEAPEGLSTQQYAFITRNTGNFVQIGFDGDDVWMQGLLSTSPYGWMKGIREGNKITFDSLQYLGIWEDAATTPHFIYFLPVSDNNNELLPEDTLTLTIDPTTSKIVADGAFVFNYLNDVETIAYAKYVGDATFVEQSDSDAPMTPANPFGVDYSRYSESAQVNIPQLSTDGKLLDADLLYYRMYVDGEPFTFYKDEYIYLDMAEMSEVPYLYTEGYDFLTGGAYREIYLYIMGAEVIGFQSIYYGGGEERVSDIVNSDGTVVKAESGVSSLTASPEVSAEYYDLFGRKVSSNTRGMVIRRAVKADGSRQVTKTMIR